MALVLLIIGLVLSYLTVGAKPVRVNTYQVPVQLPGVVGNSFGLTGVNATYDYVVIGGGTAGLAIASRLAQNFSVAVIEAGGFYEIDNGNGTLIPALSGAQGISVDIPLQPKIDWNFQTVTESNPLNRTMYYARGKTLGGSSARNLLAYQRPTVGSMQLWADEVGDESYTWDNVLPFFDRSVTITLPNTEARYPNASIDFDDYQALEGAQHGPIQVTWPNFAQPFFTWAYAAFQRIGLTANRQAFFSGSLDGVAWTPSTMDPVQQQRSTSQSGYLYQAILETDIKIYTQTLAKEILFAEDNTATGVRLSADGRDFHLNASKEVILAAGAFQSPQLLMVSGIGPRAVLEEYNIPVRNDLQGVGQNMWDHILSDTIYPVNVPTLSLLVNDPVFAADAVQQYLVNRTGMLTAGGGVLGWERLTNRTLTNVSLSADTVQALSGFPADWPEIEYIANPGGFPVPQDDRNYATIFMALITPLSRGNVTIRSADAADPPVIHLNYLSHPADMEMMVNAFKRTRSVWMELANVTSGEEATPGSNVTTDAQIEDHIRKSVRPVWHPACTCKMGKANDTMAVVDSSATVYGTRNLRVVDASAFPVLTPGHPQSVVYMLAEKIAEDILTGR